jgi:hypothetical protein
MNRTRFTPVLRTAFSSICGFATVLLVIMWARSHHTWDTINGPLSGKMLVVTSRNGGVALGLRKSSISKWHVRHSKEPNLAVEGYWYSLGFGISAAIPAVFMPYWFVILFVAMVATLPWARWSFCLRLLLIATTLVAIALGLSNLAAALRQNPALPLSGLYRKSI